VFQHFVRSADVNKDISTLIKTALAVSAPHAAA
jgi:hypothetical protein